MKGKVIINSSPIILLHKADLEFLLPALFSSIIIPDGVMDEISVVDCRFRNRPLVQEGRREIANNDRPLSSVSVVLYLIDGYRSVAKTLLESIRVPIQTG